MWLAKWWPKRWSRGLTGRDETDTDEPARFTPSAVRQTKPPMQMTNAAKPQSSSAQNKGFDPYNSGAFERGNAWERVNRR